MNTPALLTKTSCRVDSRKVITCKDSICEMSDKINATTVRNTGETGDIHTTHAKGSLNNYLLIKGS